MSTSSTATVESRPWFTPQATADHYGVSLRFIYKAIGEGRLRAYHVGRSVRIKREDVEEFAQLIESGASAVSTAIASVPRSK